jgi:hypothetical protein
VQGALFVQKKAMLGCCIEQYAQKESAKPCETRRNQKPFVRKRAHFVQIMRRRTILVVW